MISESTYFCNKTDCFNEKKPHSNLRKFGIRVKYGKSCGEQLNGLCMIVLNSVLNYAELKTAGTKFINSSPGPAENFQIKRGQAYMI